MNHRRVIFSSFLGNALEFYDFTLYGAFALIIGQTFFPAQNDLASTLQSLGAFTAGFLMRPFGAAFFGSIGDRFGRKAALQLSILLMGVPTLIIGIMPGFDQIGWWAPLLLILCRLMQGLCTGGEYNGAAIYALEHVGKKYPGLVGGTITASCGVGAFMAMGLSALVARVDMPAWAWRIPFILGTVACLWGWYIRKRLEESPAFKRIERTHTIVKSPLLDALKNHKRASLVTLMMGAVDAVVSYLPFAFVGIYLEMYRGLPATTARGLTFLSIILFTVGAPLGGYWLDVMRGKRFLVTICLVVAAGAVPAFYGLHEGSFTLLMTSILGIGLVAGAISGALPGFVQNLFPTKDRYSGISFNFNVGLSVGSTTPLILAAFSNEGMSYVALGGYVAVWGFLGAWGALLARR